MSEKLYEASFVETDFFRCLVSDAQTAAEAAHIIHKQLKDAGKTSDDIKHVKIRTQEAAVRYFRSTFEDFDVDLSFRTDPNYRQVWTSR